MLTRLQENTIERLGLEHGRVAVNPGCSIPGSDPFAEITLDTGACFHLTEDGVPHPTRPNFSEGTWRGFRYEEAA